MAIESAIQPPPARVHKRRIKQEHRAMAPGDSVKATYEEAMCIRAHGRYKGWTTRQQLQKDGKIRVWRIS